MSIHEKANKVFDESNSISKKMSDIDPNLKKKAYMVFSSKDGQCNLTNEVLGIVKEFPKALGPDESVKKIRDLFEVKAQAIKDGKSASSIDAEINYLASKLEFKDDVNVELRFNPGTLDYELIQKINESSFINKELTKSTLAPVLFNLKNYLNTKE